MRVYMIKQYTGKRTNLTNENTDDKFDLLRFVSATSVDAFL